MTDNESNNSTGFTAGETRFLVSVMKNFEGGKITFNKEAVAAELGYKDAGVVTARWGTIYRKKILNNGGTGKGNIATPKKVSPKKAVEGGGTPKKRGRKPKNAVMPDSEEELESSTQKGEESSKAPKDVIKKGELNAEANASEIGSDV